MKKSVWNGREGAFTEAEWSGVKKYWRIRFKYGMIMVAVLLVVSAMCAVTALTKDSCTSSLYAGTWVLEEDYADGFDSDDVYIEFREGNEYFRGGSYEGKLEPVSGEITLDTYAKLFGRSDSISTDFRDGKLIVKTSKAGSASTIYGTQLYTPITSSGDEGGFILPGSRPTELTRLIRENDSVSETFVRISKQCELTEQQRAELY